MKRILITGAKGLLGRALNSSFGLGDYAVFCPSREELDLSNYLKTTSYMKDNRIDAIIHCAAVVGGIQANIENPLNFISANLRIDLNILDASVSNEIKELIFFGSSCMYPRDAEQPMQESQIMTGKLELTNEAYAMGKLTTAQIVRTIAETRGWSYRTLILSNLYGPGQSEHPQKSHLIGAIHRKFRESKERGLTEIEIWGSGKARREFTHVDDISIWLAENFSRLSEFPQYLNLGYGSDFSINEYYQYFSEAYSKNFIFTHNLSKPEGMPVKLLDSSVAQSKFAWAPRISPYDGIHKLVRESG